MKKKRDWEMGGWGERARKDWGAKRPAGFAGDGSSRACGKSTDFAEPKSVARGSAGFASQSLRSSRACSEGACKGAWWKESRGVYGSALDFRGFLHAPVNEMGVVCLFGAVAAELGFQ